MVLFTDIVESTAQRQRLGERLAEEMRVAVDTLQSELITSNGGVVVKNLGDGLMASFSSASGALMCAIGIQVEIERLRPQLPEPVLLRIGIAAGDVTPDGDDIFGIPVVQAARLCNAAADGGVLVADLVRELTGRDPEITLVDPISMTLRGLDDDLIAWRLTWERDDTSVELPAGLHRDDRFGFVGRAAEWQVLTDAWARARDGEIQFATVVGEAGVGKTRLVAEFAHWALGTGATVLYGSNDQDFDVPYQPFAELLLAYVQAQPEWSLGRRLGPSRGELVRLLPELVRYVDDLPAPVVADPETERFRMFEAVTQWLHEVSATQPVLLVIDDLHWAAESTRQLLRHVAADRKSAPVLIIATQRDTTAGEAISNLPIPPQRVHRVELANFDEPTVLDFIEAAAGHSLQEIGPKLALLIHRQSGGNAFFCRELALHLVDSGIVAQTDGRWSATVALDGIGVPDSIRRVVDDRLTRIPDTARQTLLWAAIIGQDVDVALLTRVVDAPEGAVLEALETCAAARLLEERSIDRFAFPHALVRSTISASLSQTRRRSMHHRIAEELLSQRADGAAVPIGELARHFELGANDAEVLRAVELYQEAGELSLQQLAYEAAADFFERAVGLLDRKADDAIDRGWRSDLATKLVVAAASGGDPRTPDLADAATTAARASRDPERMARALLAINRGAAVVAGAVDPDRVRQLEEVRNQLAATDSALRARVLAVLATELQFSGEVERVMELSDQALVMAHRLDDPETTAFVLVERLASIRLPGHLEARLSDAVELGRLSRLLGDERSEFFATYFAADTHLNLNDINGFRSSTEHAKRIVVSRLGQSLQLPRVLRIEEEVFWLAGDLDRAEATLDEMMRVAREINQERQNMASYLGSLSKLATARGNPQVAVDSFRILAALPKGTDGFTAGLAVALEFADQRDEARDLYEELIFKGIETLSLDLTRTHTLCFMASLCTSFRDVERAASIEHELLPFAHHWVTAGANSYGPVKHFLARLDAISGRRDDAEASFADASARCQAMQAPLLEAWNQISWAEFSIDNGDLDRGRELAAAAAATAARHNAWGIESAARSVTVGATN